MLVLEVTMQWLLLILLLINLLGIVSLHYNLIRLDNENSILRRVKEIESKLDSILEILVRD